VSLTGAARRSQHSVHRTQCQQSRSLDHQSLSFPWGVHSRVPRDGFITQLRQLVQHPAPAASSEPLQMPRAMLLHLSSLPALVAGAALLFRQGLAECPAATYAVGPACVDGASGAVVALTGQLSTSEELSSPPTATVAVRFITQLLGCAPSGTPITSVSGGNVTITRRLLCGDTEYLRTSGTPLVVNIVERFSPASGTAVGALLFSDMLACWPLLPLLPLLLPLLLATQSLCCMSLLATGAGHCWTPLAGHNTGHRLRNGRC
jgi:hypothetical protein